MSDALLTLTLAAVLWITAAPCLAQLPRYDSNVIAATSAGNEPQSVTSTPPPIAPLFARRSIKPPPKNSTQLPTTTQKVQAQQEAGSNLPANTNEAVGYCMQGIQCINQGLFAPGAAAFTDAIRLNPRMVEAYVGRARCYSELNQIQDSLNDCNAAIGLDPNSSSAYTMRGGAYFKLQKFQEALADHDTAAKLNGNRTPGIIELLNLAADQYALRQYREALSYADQVVAQDSGNDRAYGIRGLAHSELNEFASAMSDFDQAIKLAPDNPDYRCYRGYTELKMNKLDDAMADFTFAIDRRHDYGIAYYDRGITHMLKGDYAGAIRDIQDAIRTDHRFSLAMYEFKLDKAKKGQRADLSNPEDYYYRACTRILMVKNETALSDLRRYLSKTNWQGPLAPAVVLAVYLGNMRNHNTSAANKILKSAGDRCNKSTWPYPIIGYLRNEVPVNELLAQAGDNDRLTDVHAYVGLSEVLAGNGAATSNSHLDWVKQNGSNTLISYDLAIQQLEKEIFTGPKFSETPYP